MISAPSVAGRAAEEVDPPCDDVDRVATRPVLLPGPAVQPPLDGDASALGQVLGAELRLTVPGRDPDEVRAGLAAAAIDGEKEARHLLLLADIAHLDVGREVPDQAHGVHTAKLAGQPSRGVSRLSSDFPEMRS